MQIVKEPMRSIFDTHTDVSILSKLCSQCLLVNDPNAILLYSCVEIYLYFFFSLLEKCDKEEIKEQFREECRTMLQRCLPLIRAKVLYFCKVPWFSKKDQHLALPSNIPSLDARIMSLIELFEFSEEADIMGYLQPCFEIPFDITEEVG